ncbi:hypothetical protein ACRALDRAFT_2058396 [Sodiomyces alcalophilus JCM 7366]|uniref:uncharacterized protein n=1 Tax=Sodiomyces alcalophilus JCM 7366 TaxID=591952 RepID=UPI0039B3F37B
MSTQATSTPQVNGVPSSAQNPSQQTTSTSQQNTPQSQSATQPSQPQSQQPAQQQSQQQPPDASSSAPRPRDARMIELLLTSQGVTSYETRVPLFLLDFAYRHTSSILNDALHLGADPYTTHAGAKPSAHAGPASIPGSGGDATVSANAIKIAIASRLVYQFRGGRGSGGISKDWLQDLAKEHNRVALPRVAPNEWGVRLPSERFVLTGTSWGLKDVWEEAGMDEDESDEEPELQQGGGGGGAMEGVEPTGAAATADEKNEDGEEVEGGTMEDVFGKDMEDEEMGGSG